MPVDCAVCLSPYNFRAYPVVGKCGHSICQLCSSNLRDTKCPICRSRKSFEEPARNHRAYEMIQEMMIRTDEDKVRLEHLAQIQDQVRATKDLVSEMKAIEEPQSNDDSDSDNFSLDESRDEDVFDRLAEVHARRQQQLLERETLIRMRPRRHTMLPQGWMSASQERRGRDHPRERRPPLQNQQQQQWTEQNYRAPIQPNYAQLNTPVYPGFAPHVAQGNQFYGQPVALANHGYHFVQPIHQQPILPIFPIPVQQYNPMNLVPNPFYPQQR